MGETGASSGGKSSSSLSGVGKEGYLYKGNLCPPFRCLEGGQRTLPASVDFQLPSAQNHHSVKEVYFGVA